MRVGILGTGDVGKALGRGFITLGHDGKMGSREAKNEKALVWAKAQGSRDPSCEVFRSAAECPAGSSGARKRPSWQTREMSVL